MVTVDDYKRVCKIAAKVVAKHGDHYLPLFERAYRELKSAEANIELTSMAMAMALDKE